MDKAAEIFLKLANDEAALVSVLRISISPIVSIKISISPIVFLRISISPIVFLRISISPIVFLRISRSPIVFFYQFLDKFSGRDKPCWLAIEFQACPRAE